MSKIFDADGKEILVDHMGRLIIHPEVLQVDNSSAFRVEGIENWIQTLIPMQEPNLENRYDAIRMVDPKTGALFAVARLKDV